MTTFYLDYEGGNDASDGLSFANRWKTITAGATAARIAPGDTIRCMASPDPTSLGINGTWTSGPLGTAVNIASSTNATPIVVTLSSGNYATLAPAVGDTVVILGHTTNTKANGIWKVSAINGVSFTVTLVNADGTNSVGNGVGGATGTIRKYNNCCVILASAITKAIACVGNQGTKTNWTASANVTCTVTTSDFKEGGECQQIAIAGGFATGLAAFLATGTLDLSAYQQVTFWIKQTAGTIAVSGDARLELSTDATGTAVVHNIPVPALLALNQWVPVTVDLATNMNSGIQSIGWNQLVDRGAQTFLVDCVTACKASSSADSLTLTSLIGKNAAGESWYALQSINDVRVMLAQIANTIPNSGSGYRGYYGVTETVTTHKRETIALAMGTAASTAIQTVQDSGTSGSPITFSGGWDRTNMSSQSGETFWDGRNGFGYNIVTSSKSYITFEKIHPYRCTRGYSCTNGDHIVWNGTIYAQHNGSSGHGILLDTCNLCTIGTLFANNNTNSGLEFISSHGHVVTTLHAHGAGGTAGLMLNANTDMVFANTFTTINASNSADDGVGSQQLGSGGVHYNNLGTVTVIGNVGDGVQLTGHAYNTIVSLTTQNNGARGINLSSGAHENYILGGSSSGNISTGMVGVTTTLPTRNYFRNFTVAEATVVSTMNNGSNGQVRFEKYGGVDGDNRVFTDGGTIVSQTAVRHAASGIAWQLSPTNATRDAQYPLFIQTTAFAVAANALVTVKCWIRRSSASITAKMVCQGGQIAGVATDVSVTASGGVDAWQEETITFTPTEAGTVVITFQAYGGTTLSAYFDDMTITQA